MKKLTKALEWLTMLALTGTALVFLAALSSIIDKLLTI